VVSNIRNPVRNTLDKDYYGVGEIDDWTEAAIYPPSMKVKWVHTYNCSGLKNANTAIITIENKNP